jgi:hypothetical protein
MPLRHGDLRPDLNRGKALAARAERPLYVVTSSGWRCVAMCEADGVMLLRLERANPSAPRPQDAAIAGREAQR